MTKKEIQQRVLKDGKPLAFNKFKWNSKTSEFSSEEFGLVFDFSGISGITFNTVRDCTFKTGYYCTFNTGWLCTFNTGFECTFKTDFECTFNTGPDCTFATGSYCTFKTGSYCTFNTSYGCIFNTGSACTWIIKGEKYTFSPLFIQGSAWPIDVYKPNTLKIGCKEHTFDYWLKNAKEIVAEHKVPDKYDEYLGLIKVAYGWAKLKGWDK